MKDQYMSFDSCPGKEFDLKSEIDRKYWMLIKICHYNYHKDSMGLGVRHFLSVNVSSFYLQSRTDLFIPRRDF